MDSLIHADIFFFVTTIAVVLVTIVFTIALFYLIAVLRRVRDVAQEIKDEAVLVREDIHDARKRIEREGFRLKHIVDFFSGFGSKKGNGGSKKKRSR